MKPYFTAALFVIVILLIVATARALAGGEVSQASAPAGWWCNINRGECVLRRAECVSESCVFRRKADTSHTVRGRWVGQAFTTLEGCETWRRAQIDNGAAYARCSLMTPREFIATSKER